MYIDLDQDLIYDVAKFSCTDFFSHSFFTGVGGGRGVKPAVHPEFWKRKKNHFVVPQEKMTSVAVRAIQVDVPASDAYSLESVGKHGFCKCFCPWLCDHKFTVEKQFIFLFKHCSDRSWSSTQRRCPGRHIQHGEGGLGAHAGVDSAL